MHKPEVGITIQKKKKKKSGNLADVEQNSSYKVTESIMADAGLLAIIRREFVGMRPGSISSMTAIYVILGMLVCYRM